MDKKPLHEALNEYLSTNALPMHMPGGKRRIGFLAANDITEIAGFDNLHNPSGIIMELESDLASLWNAGEAFLSVNGATAMIGSAICAAMRYFPEGRILAASNCHLSVWHGIEMSGCMHRIIDPSIGEYPFAMDVSPEAVEKALREDPGIRAVVITSPTYEGVISDTASIYNITRKYDCTLIVDEAHGAHLGLDDYWGNDATGDLVIKSTHKTLSSPTQTAVMLNYSDRVSGEDIRHYIDIFESTSPSYLLMSGMSEMCSFLSQKDCMRPWIDGVREARDRLSQLKNIKLFSADNADPSKFVLLCQGTEVAEILRDQYNIEVEAAFTSHLIAMSGIGDNTDTLMRFVQAIEEIDGSYENFGIQEFQSCCPVKHITAMSLSQVARCPSEKISISSSKGRISAEFVYNYPPGIPLILPGDEITEDQVRFSPIHDIRAI